MATSRKERFKIYKAKKRWLIAGLAFAGVAMMSGGQVSADQMSDAQVEPAKTAVSAQLDPSAATGAVVTPTSATLTTDATTTESTDQEAAAKPVSTPAPATTTTTPVAATTEVSTDKAVTDKPAVQPQATTQAPAQSTTAPVADTTQDNGQQATTDANTAHTWDYATDADVQSTVDTRINGVVNSNGEVIANGGNFTQSDQWSTARVDNGYSVTVTIHNESGKYKNGDTIRIPISGEMSSDVAGVAKQKFDVRETQGTLMNGNVALGTYTIADGYFSIKLTQDLFGESTSELTISGTSGSAPVASSAIWMNKKGFATITFGNAAIKGTLEFTVQPKATNGASATQKLNTASDKIGVQSSFQDNNYLGALYSGDTKNAKNDETGSFNQDIVQIQHIVIEQGTVRSVSLDRTYTSLYVPMTDKNGNIVASAVSAADVTLNIGKEIQINLDPSIDDVTAMESAVAKSLKNKGVGSYAIVQRKDGSYIVAYNIGNPYKDYSATDVLNNVEFTKFLKDGNNQGLLTDAQLNQLKTNIALASAGKNSVGIGAIAHIFNVNFASNDTPNEVTSTLDTNDVNGNNLANWGDKDVTTTPDKQNYNGQARLVVSYLDDKDHALAPDKTSLAPSGLGYTETPNDIPGYTFSYVHGVTAGVYGPANETTSVIFYYKANTQHATVTYIDEVTGKELSVDEISGDSNTKSIYTTDTKIKDYEKQGYKFASSNFPDDGFTFDTDDDKSQDYTVKFTHDTTKTDTPQTPGTPIDPENPKGPKWPNEVTKDKLTKTVNETIHYVYAGGAKAADDKTDTVSFSRTATVDAVTGKFIAYGEWTADDNDTTFDAVKSPVIAGYTVSGDVPAFTGLTADHEDVTETVTYTADDQKVVYNVIDDTNNKQLVTNKLFDEGVTAGELKKTKADLQTIANDFVKQGYKIVSVGDVPGVFDNDDDTDQVVNIHLTHTMKPVTDENQLDVKVTEIVHYVYKDGTTAAPDVTDTVEFTRTGIIDEATDIVTYTDWTAVNGDNSFDTKVSPVITGYIANEANVAEVDGLTSASKNVEETVTYSKLGSYVPELPDGSTPSVPYPNDPTDPSKPGTDVPAMPHVPGYTPVGPDGKPLTPVDPQDPSKGYNPPAVPSDPTTDTVIKYGADKQNVVYNVINDTTGENLVTNAVFDSGDTDAALTKGQADLQAIADAYIEQGYDVVSVDAVPGSFDDDDTVDQIVNIHLKNKTATAMVPNEPMRVATAMVPNEPVYPTPVAVPNGPVNVPTSVVTGDNTTRVGKPMTNTPTKLGATSGSSVVITRADANAKAKNSVANSNTVSLPDTAAKGNQDENALLVALAVIASLLTFGFVQKRK